MRRFVVTGILSLVLSACATQSAPAVSSEPVTVLNNARIFTADRAGLWAEAIAIQGERIVAVGKNASVMKEAQRRGAVTVHDMQGRVIVPGFNDAHFHGGKYPEHVAIEVSAQDPLVAEVASKLRDAVAAHPAGTWLTVEVGGIVLNDPQVNRATLDAISTSHAIVLASWAGHGMIANSVALERFGLDDRSRDPMGGKLGRTPDGKLSGRLDEYAGYGAMRAFAARTPEQARVDRYAQVSPLFLSLGLTSMQNMSNAWPAPDHSAYIARAATPVRFRVIRFPMTTADSFGADADVAPPVAGSRPGVKWILDGTPVERGAAMTVAYADDPSARGALNFSRETIAQMLEAADARGEQPMFHATGDEAVAALLDAMDATGGAARWKARRVRIEHGDMATAAQLARMRDLGIVYVQNPAHLMVVPMMRARYAPRVDAVQPMKSVLAAGVPLAIGSDGPTNPFLNIMFATIHPTTPSEALTREEAVIAYTHGSAYAEFAENEKGTLAVGKLADLAVVDADIFTIPADDLPKVLSVLTMVGGKIVHRTN